MIGYMTDSQTVATASRSLGLSATSDPRLGMVVSFSLRTLCAALFPVRGPDLGPPSHASPDGLNRAAHDCTYSSHLTPQATIDHTIHFYPFPSGYDGSQPLLHVVETTVADLTTGRGFVNGRVYTQDGVLIAGTSQEGVVRPHMSGKKPRRETARL
jgi:hypothetical protein